MPKFSIIIPVYNVAPYLRECLDSVLAQTFTDWEAICVDDGSTDGSGAILDEYAAKDGRFRVIHQKNAGVSVARQIGLNVVLGEYVTWIDPDDWVDNNYLDCVDRDIRLRGDVDVLWFDCFDEKGGIRKYSVQQVDICPQVNMLLLISGRLHGSVWTKFFRRDFLTSSKVKFPSQRIVVCEDFLFVIYLMKASPSIRKINAAFYHYRIHEVSVTHSMRHQGYYESLKFVGEELFSMVDNGVLRAAVENWCRLVKVNAFTNRHVSDEFFYSFFPEICTVGPSDYGRFYRFLFFISCRGWRQPVMWLVNGVKFVKEIF